MSRPLLEVIACSALDARAAAAGGADRLELCRRLDLAGLTPPLGVVESVCREVQIPARVMVRTNRGFQVTPEEMAEMELQIAEMVALPIEGVICGFLDAAGQLDFAALDRVLRLAPPHWRLTIHRVFDEASGEPEAKLQAVRRHGRADCILAGIASAGRLAPLTGGGIEIMVGGGLTLRNAASWRSLGCPAFHVGRAVRSPEESTAPVNRDKVRSFREFLDGESGGI